MGYWRLLVSGFGNLAKGLSFFVVYFYIMMTWFRYLLLTSPQPFAYYYPANLNDLKRYTKLIVKHYANYQLEIDPLSSVLFEAGFCIWSCCELALRSVFVYLQCVRLCCVYLQLMRCQKWCFLDSRSRIRQLSSLQHCVIVVLLLAPRSQRLR